MANRLTAKAMSLCPKVRSSSEHGETVCYRAGTSGANSLVPSPVCLATALEGPFACPLGQVCLGNGWDVRVKYNNQKVCTVCRSVMRRFHWSALDVVGLVICAFCCVSSSFLSLGIWARHGSFISSSSDPCSSPTYVSPAFRSPFGKTDAMRMASPNQVYYKICSEKSRDHHALSRYTVRRHPDEDARL